MMSTTSDVAISAAAAAADHTPSDNTTRLQELPPSSAARATASEISRQMEIRFIPSNDLMISCGCVLVDPDARKIAILHNTVDGTTQLPKGRKNIGEDILATALRETWEETGIPCKALPLRVATRSTPTPEMLGPLYRSEIESVTTTMPNCEPSSVCIYRCAFTMAFKIVFWFAAYGNSGLTPDEDLKEPWEQDLKLEWANASEAGAQMTHKADGSVIEKVLSDMRNSGYQI